MLPIIPPPIRDSPPLIQVRKLVKVYQTAAGDFTAVKDLDVEVRQGEFVAVIGKSGSGKSTFVNMLTGIDRPTSGEILVAGAPLHTYSEGQLAAWRGRNLGIVFQFFQLIPTLTVLENVILPMELNHLFGKAERRARAMHLLETVELAAQANKLPAAISGGQQQRAAIARSLANDPPLIIADEPTGNLDSHTAERIFGLFEDLVASGKTVLMVTHDSDLARRVDRTILISNGEIVHEYLVKALASLTQDQLSEVARRVAPQVFPPEAVIIHQGETGDKFYILLEGRGEVLIDAPGGGQILVGRLKPGNYFGEMALLGQGVRTATVRVSGDSQARVAALDSTAFNDLISALPGLRDELAQIVARRNASNQVKALAANGQSAINAVARDLERLRYEAGAEVIRQGELGDAFYLITDGQVDIFVKNLDGEEVWVNQLGKGQFFGELALLGDHRRTASVRVSKDGPAHFLKLSQDEFERSLDASDQFRNQVEEQARQRKVDLRQARNRKAGA